MSTKPITQPQPDFFTVGGTLNNSAPSYVPRSADKELWEMVQRRNFCYVLTPRQMGKSSLMIRTVQQLNKKGERGVVIDLTSIGTGNLTIDEWYFGQIHRIAQQLRMSVNYFTWWKQASHLGAVQRFSNFLTNVVLNEVAVPITIFVDEIDTTLSLPTFSDDYFAAIRALYNERPLNPELERLTFVLLGVASPSDLIKNPQRTPFNIGKRIMLTDFTLHEAQILATGLAPTSESALILLERVLHWTGGHPYLTQKTCNRVAQWAQASWNPSDVSLIVDDLVQEMFLSETGRKSDDNLSFIRNQVLEPEQTEPLITLYRHIRQGQPLHDTELDPLPVKLKLSGLVKATEGGILKVRNPIYEQVFDDSWIRSVLAEPMFESVETTQFHYDVFISYSSRDGDWVRHYLVGALESAGLHVMIDYRDFQLGAPIITEMERAIASSRQTIVVLTPDYIASSWSEFESLTLQTLDPSARTTRLIPLLLKKCDLPIRLAVLTHLDFTQTDHWDSQMSRLLSALGGSRQSIATTKTVSPTITDTIKYNTGAIRKLLKEAFQDEELDAFVYDYFGPVYRQFSNDISTHAKIQMIIEYTEKNNLLGILLDQVAQLSPRQYRRFIDQAIVKE